MNLIRKDCKNTIYKNKNFEEIDNNPNEDYL